jgi:hypothetical protein
MEFRFIDNDTRLDRRTQKLIRSHAMKGKNLGKIIPARGHKNLLCKQNSYAGQVESKSETFAKFDNGNHLGDNISGSVISLPNYSNKPSLLNPFCGAEFSFFAFPIEATPSVRYLLNKCMGLLVFFLAIKLYLQIINCVKSTMRSARSCTLAFSAASRR